MQSSHSESELNQLQERKEETKLSMFFNFMVCAFQTTFGYICLDICIAISLHYINSEIGSIANSGYGFALICINILITPIGFGFNQSLNMHTSQALGDGKIQLAKQFFNVNFYALLVVLLPLVALLFGTLKHPLNLIISEENRDSTSDYALEFLCYLIPGIVLAIEFESAKIFMMAHKITYPFIYIHFVTFGLHWFFNWLFVSHLHLGVFGAGFPIILTEIFNIIGLLLFIYLTKIKEQVFQGTNIIIDIQLFKNLGCQYLKTSMPIVLHILAEIFIFFFLSFIALSLGTPEMNAHLGLQSVCGTLFRIPISISIALMSFVGTEMGKGDVKKAKMYVVIGLLIYALTTAICSILLWVLREPLATFFTSSDHEEYSNKAREIFIDAIPWLIGGMIIVDGLQGTLSGALKGINLVNFVFITTMITYYVICIPLLFCFAYDWGVGQGVLGLWQAFGLANCLLAVLYVTFLFVPDWKKLSGQILKRVKQDNELQQVAQPIPSINPED